MMTPHGWKRLRGVQRRERPAHDRSNVATMELEIALNGQTRSQEFVCGVIAMNSAGERRIQRQRHGGAVTCRRQLR